MKLSYVELNSFMDIQLEKVGTLRKPRIGDIYGTLTNPNGIGQLTYDLYMSVVTMTVDSYFDKMGKFEKYNSLTVDKKAEYKIFYLLQADPLYSTILSEALKFFMREEVEWSNDFNAYILYQSDGKNKHTVGTIDATKWEELRDIIAQINHISIDEDIGVVRSKKARGIIGKLQAGRAKMKTAKAKADAKNKDFEIGNIISSLCGNPQSGYNYLNIWDMTIYQMWDAFNRCRISESYTARQMNISVWGDKKNQFDTLERFRNINESN